jgi:hypothetical protein
VEDAEEIIGPHAPTSGGLEDCEDSDGATEMAQSSAIGRHMLAVNGADTQEAPDLVEGTTESPRRPEALEASHRTVSILDPTVVLLEPIVEVGVRPMSHYLAEFAADRRRVRIVTIARDPVRRHTGDRSGGTKECLVSR